MSSRSLGLLAGFFVSQGKSSPASCRLMSSGSSVRNRILPWSFTCAGSLATARSLSAADTVKFYRSTQYSVHSAQFSRKSRVPGPSCESSQRLAADLRGSRGFDLYLSFSFSQFLSTCQFLPPSQFLLS